MASKYLIHIKLSQMCTPFQATTPSFRLSVQFSRFDTLTPIWLPPDWNGLEIRLEEAKASQQKASLEQRVHFRQIWLLWEAIPAMPRFISPVLTFIILSIKEPSNIDIHPSHIVYISRTNFL